MYVDEMRAFNRFYTNILGLLNTHILNSKYSLAEVRILYELYHHKNFTAREVVEALAMDKGQLSRILLKLEGAKLISRKQSLNDKRAVHLTITKKGGKEFEILNESSNNQVKNFFKTFSDEELSKLTGHMKEIQRMLSGIHN